MKTIEERAKASLEFYDWNIYYHYSELTEDSFKDGYIQGATEQKKIDIEKACEWLKVRNVLTDASLEGFKRVMEEE